MDYKNKYIKYKKNNFIIIGNIRGNDLDFIPELKRKLKSLMVM